MTKYDGENGEFKGVDFIPIEHPALQNDREHQIRKLKEAGWMLDPINKGFKRPGASDEK